MKTLYHSSISDRRWWLYDIPGNIGWITYIYYAIREVQKKKDCYNVAALIPAVLMLTGVSELISERIVGLDRILTGKMLLCGFGSMTAGGILGIPLALAGFRKGKNHAGGLLASSVLCAVFAGLLLRGYKSQSQNIDND